MIACIEHITKIEERTRKVHVQGVGKDAVFRDEPTGWYITLESGTTLGVASAEGFVEGDKVKLALYKAL